MNLFINYVENLGFFQWLINLFFNMNEISFVYIFNNIFSFLTFRQPLLINI